jgi:Co/Zn/Cd efflux system component
MSAHCSQDHLDTSLVPGSPAYAQYRRVLWNALFINALMFGLEVFASMQANSLSLLADSIDFFADATNYGISLAVLGASLTLRSRAALFKALTMAALGLFVLSKAYANWQLGVIPQARTMGAIAVLALFANLSVASMLYRFRTGDANMRSVWLCSRNDALSNIAVLCAAAGVFGTGHGWPDLLVGTIMAVLALSAALSITRQAISELRAPIT